MGTNEIQNLLIPLANHQDLSLEQSVRAFQIILSGGATPAQMAAFLMGLRQKGETVEEITGGATALRAKSLKIHAPEGTMDTCGTGGDTKGTLNVSTATAIVVASCGVPVAKHGNRGVTSASGSSDVLAALGVNVAAEIPVIERSLLECGMCFMLAPHFHPAMRHVAPVRQELGLRTIFNILGPLSNPASPKLQLVGVYARELLEPVAEVLAHLGVERAWVVHGSDGMDELTLTGPTYVTEMKNGVIDSFTVDPEALGMKTVPLEALRGQDAHYNAHEIVKLLAGEGGAYRDVVLLNAGACLVIAGKAASIEEGMTTAATAIDSGKSRETLAKLTLTTNQPA